MKIKIGDTVRLAWTVKGITYPPVTASLDAVDDLDGVKMAVMTRIGKTRDDGTSINYYLTEVEISEMTPSTHADDFITI